MIAALLAAVVLLGPVEPSGVELREPPCSHIAWQRGDAEVRRLIRCVARRWTPPGGHRAAVEVARCESTLDPSVIGGAGDAHYGLFQQRDVYWPGRWAKWGVMRGAGGQVLWRVSRDPLDALANTIVSLRQAREVGWYPWECRP